MIKALRGVAAGILLVTGYDVLVLACRIVGVWRQYRPDDALQTLEAILER